LARPGVTGRLMWQFLSESLSPHCSDPKTYECYHAGVSASWRSKQLASHTDSPINLRLSLTFRIPLLHPSAACSSMLL